MKNEILATVIVVVIFGFILSCIPLDTAPHTNPLDPLYGDDTIPPSKVDLNPLDTQYVNTVALSWSQPEEYVMILRSPLPINDDIIEQQKSYIVGEIIGNATVIYIGDGTEALDENLDTDGGLYYRTFAFDEQRNYNLDSEQDSTLVYVDAIYVHWNGNSSNAGTSVSPLAGIQAGILKASAIGLHEVRIAGDENKVEGYSVPDTVSMHSGVSLYGGYNPDSWDSPSDPLRWPTIVTRTGSDTGDMMTILASNLSGAEVISGLRVNIFPSISGQYTSAIHIQKSDIRVEYCELTGGDSGGIAESCGIKIVSAAPLITDNYSINGGSSSSSFGILIEGTVTDPSAPQIINNNYSANCITGGSGTGDSVGIYFQSDSTGTVSGNRIKGCSSSSSSISVGIYLQDASAAINYNYIDGSSVADVNNYWSYGLYIDSCWQGVNIFNNYISTSDNKIAVGIRSANSDINVRNNTIYCSSVDQSPWVIYILATGASDNIYIQNNIIQSSSAGNSIGINQSGDYTAAELYLVQNNNFYGMGTVYDDGFNMQPWTTVTEMQSNITGTSDNREDSLPLNTTDGSVDTTSPWVEPFATAGLDGLGNGWGFSTDITGTERTDNGSGAGWSIGAYEYDAP